MVSRAEELFRWWYHFYAVLPCQRAHVCFDQITEHGSNGITPEEAIGKAIQAYPVQLPDSNFLAPIEVRRGLWSDQLECKGAAAGEQ